MISILQILLTKSMIHNHTYTLNFFDQHGKLENCMRVLKGVHVVNRSKSHKLWLQNKLHVWSLYIIHPLGVGPLSKIRTLFRFVVIIDNFWCSTTYINDKLMLNWSCSTYLNLIL